LPSLTVGLLTCTLIALVDYHPSRSSLLGQQPGRYRSGAELMALRCDIHYDGRVEGLI